MVKQIFFFSLFIISACTLKTESRFDPVELIVPTGKLVGSVVLLSGDSAKVMATGSDSMELSLWLSSHRYKTCTKNVFCEGLIRQQQENSVKTVEYLRGLSRLVVYSDINATEKNEDEIESSDLSTLVIFTGNIASKVSPQMIYENKSSEIVIAGSIDEDSVISLVNFCQKESLTVSFPLTTDIHRFSTGERWH